ncbi:MAG: SUMF1/EgtB/PvdO family nonheme iron enzyme [Deltaproteobacteria bacterium]|nr:SUMF1/EgtB/PvdO family nonheme iron enzyme [Deltaproteobacteria bacterium]
MTVSAFRLDRFEVTEGRFRKFRSAWVAGWRPAGGAGKHRHLPGGGFAGETGWLSSWNAQVDSNLMETGGGGLKCGGSWAWSSQPDASENTFMNCPNWYSSYAFCIWDGGFLPSEREFEYTASGGQDRVFPWSNPPSSDSIDATRAAYDNNQGRLVPGSLPAGGGRWGHDDLGGNAREWVLDWYDENAGSIACTDCANAGPEAGLANRVERGGSFYYSSTWLRGAARGQAAPDGQDDTLGFRCARSP